MDDPTNFIVFWAVVLARFFIPLAIPRFPFPTIIVAMVLDAIDQTIFQQFTTINLDGYQGYDKSLDIYYLTIAYTATLRNWTNLYAFKVSRFLWYYRLFGVVLFELTQLRWILFVFPNTFEYFFIYYETVRLRWDPVKLTRKGLLIAAAAIWIFIKLPQEWWIHIAQLDMTDFLKENIFGVPTDATLEEILQANLWIIPALIILIVVIIVGGRWLLRRLPPADWKLSFDADAHQLSPAQLAQDKTRQLPAEPFFSRALLEKIVLVSLVSIIFAQVLEATATNLQLALGVAVVIIVNSALSQWLARRGTEWRHLLVQFAVMAAANFATAALVIILLPRLDGAIDVQKILFFGLLLTLIVTLFDRYRPAHLLRFAADNAQG